MSYGWPKQCPHCDRTFTEQQWRSLSKRGYVGTFRAAGCVYAVELRECICAEHMGLEVTIPVAQPVGQKATAEVF